MSRMFTTAAVSLTAILFAAGSAVAANDCTIAKKGDNAVVKACDKGGIKEAKKTMKAMVKVAKDKGKKWECDSCHKDETEWKLTDDGEKLFKELLALQK
jgi:Na+-transporting NADH:ubiquinone oxidoreductase subunit NqrF